MSYRIMVTGSRTLDSAAAVLTALDRHYLHGMTSLVVGDCPSGADAFARAWADARGVPIEEFKADWTKYGKSAGHKRNTRMILSGPAVCLAFFATPDSPGTLDATKKAIAAKIPVRLYGNHPTDLES